MTEFRWQHVLEMSRQCTTLSFTGRVADASMLGGRCVAAARREQSGSWIGLVASPDGEIMDVEITADVDPNRAREEFERTLREDARWESQ